MWARLQSIRSTVSDIVPSTLACIVKLAQKCVQCLRLSLPLVVTLLELNTGMPPEAQFQKAMTPGSNRLSGVRDGEVQLHKMLC